MHIVVSRDGVTTFYPGDVPEPNDSDLNGTVSKTAGLKPIGDLEDYTSRAINLPFQLQKGTFLLLKESEIKGVRPRDINERMLS